MCYLYIRIKSIKTSFEMYFLYMHIKSIKTRIETHFLCMKCKNCGSKVPTSKPLLIFAIVEGILIILLIAFLIFGINSEQKENDSSTVPKSKSVAEQLTDSVNSTPYYKNCNWCPNYGFITGAKPTKWDATDNNPVYEYPFDQNQMNKYIETLEGYSFVKNPFSNGDMLIYSRNYLGKTQSIVVSPDENNIYIYMTEE